VQYIGNSVLSISHSFLHHLDDPEVILKPGSTIIMGMALVDYSHQLSTKEIQ
jgi:hypothetical protein